MTSIYSDLFARLARSTRVGGLLGGLAWQNGDGVVLCRLGLLTTLHEIAHAVMARTVGWRVIGPVGLGPVVSEA